MAILRIDWRAVDHMLNSPTGMVGQNCQQRADHTAARARQFAPGSMSERIAPPVVQPGPGGPSADITVRHHAVGYVINGHGHQFVRMVRDGVVYMEVGSSGGNMTGGLVRGQGFADGRFYHWVWGHVRGSRVNLTVKEIGGQMGQGRMFSAEDWDENGPKFDIADPGLSAGPET